MTTLLVTAVVVTYNRRDLLVRCLEALDRQSQPVSRIIIVDNASTDGTIEHLHTTGWTKRPDVYVHALEENQGGAGGFAEGVRKAVAFGAEWVWLMDDDGYPADDCLDKLVREVGEHDLESISSIQVDIDNHTVPAFPTFDAHGMLINRLPYAPSHGSHFVPHHANLFNGLLIRSTTIVRIGAPRAELFIRGDEVEYTRRMLMGGVKFGTLANAYFYHPSDRAERHTFLFGLGFARDANSDFKNYYMFRNKGLAFRENGWLWMLPFDAVRYLYYFLVHKRWDSHGLGVWASAMYDGLRGKLGRHPKY